MMSGDGFGPYREGEAIASFACRTVFHASAAVLEQPCILVMLVFMPLGLCLFLGGSKRTSTGTLPGSPGRGGQGGWP